MLSGRKISHTNRRCAGGVCGQGSFTEQHFITPDVQPGCRHSHRRTGWEWMLYTPVYIILNSRKFPITVPWVLLEVCVWKNSGVTEISHQSIHKRFSTKINILRNRVTYTKSGSRTLHFVQSVGLLTV